MSSPIVPSTREVSSNSNDKKHAKDAHGNNKGWGSMSGWGSSATLWGRAKEKEKRDFTVAVDHGTFLKLADDEKLEYLLPDPGKTSLMKSLLPPYGYSSHAFFSNSFKFYRTFREEVESRTFCDLGKAIVSSPGNFGVVVPGRSKPMYACFLCESSHLAKTFKVSLSRKPWSELGESTQEKFRHNDSLYECGFYETANDYMCHLQGHDDAYHTIMASFLDKNEKARPYKELMGILAEREEEKYLELDAFLQQPLEYQNKFLLPNLKDCIPVTQFIRSDFKIQEGIDAAMNVFEEKRKEVGLIVHASGDFANFPDEAKTRMVVTVLSRSLGSFGVTNKEGEKAHLVCCFCGGFMSHLFHLIDPVCRHHTAFKMLKKSSNCDIYLSKKDFIQHLEEEAERDIYHKVYLEYLNVCTSSFKNYIFQHILHDASKDKEIKASGKARRPKVRKCKRKRPDNGQMEVLYYYYLEDACTMYKTLINGKEASFSEEEMKKEYNDLYNEFHKHTHCDKNFDKLCENISKLYHAQEMDVDKLIIEEGIIAKYLKNGPDESSLSQKLPPGQKVESDILQRLAKPGSIFDNVEWDSEDPLDRNDSFFSENKILCRYWIEVDSKTHGAENGKSRKLIFKVLINNEVRKMRTSELRANHRELYDRHRQLMDNSGGVLSVLKNLLSDLWKSPETNGEAIKRMENRYHRALKELEKGARLGQMNGGIRYRDLAQAYQDDLSISSACDSTFTEGSKECFIVDGIMPPNQDEKMSVLEHNVDESHGGKEVDISKESLQKKDNSKESPQKEDNSKESPQERDNIKKSKKERDNFKKKWKEPTDAQMENWWENLSSDSDSEKEPEKKQSRKKSLASFHQDSIPRKILKAVAPHELTDCKEMEKLRIDAFLNFSPLNNAVKEGYNEGDPRYLNKVFASMRGEGKYLGGKDKVTAGSKDNPIDICMDDGNSANMDLEDVVTGSPAKKTRTETLAQKNKSCLTNNSRTTKLTTLQEKKVKSHRSTGQLVRCVQRSNTKRNVGRIWRDNNAQPNWHGVLHRRPMMPYPLPPCVSNVVKDTKVKYDINKFQKGIVNFTRKIDFEKFPEIKPEGHCFSERIQRTFINSNKQIVSLLLAPFTCKQEEILKSYEMAKQNFPKQERELIGNPWLHRLDLEVFVHACRSHKNFPNVRILTEHWKIFWLVTGNTDKKILDKSYKDFSYAVRVKLNFQPVTERQMGIYASNRRNFKLKTEEEVKKNPEHVRCKLNDRCKNEQYKNWILNLEMRYHQQIIGPRWTTLVVVPGKYFFCEFAKVAKSKDEKEKGGEEFEKLPIEWLRINRDLHPDKGFDYAHGFIADIDKKIALVFESRYPLSVRTGIPSYMKDCSSVLQHSSTSVGKEKKILPFLHGVSAVGSSTGVVIHPSLQQRRSGLVHRVRYLKSVSDDISMIGRAPQLIKMENAGDIKLSETAKNVVGRRMFWVCDDLKGPIHHFQSSTPIRADSVKSYLLLQCDSLSAMPYKCQGCCFMYSNGEIWNFGVIAKFTEECLRYHEFTVGSLLLHPETLEIKTSNLLENYIFKFVNVFHKDCKLLRNDYLHHCVVNCYGNVEAMLKPSIHKSVMPMSEVLLRKEIRAKKKAATKSLCARLGEEYVNKNRKRSSLHRRIFGREKVHWHTIFVLENTNHLYQEICDCNPLENSYYIVVPSPLFEVNKSKWITLDSGFRYCYRMHFVIDVLHLKTLNKIKTADEMYYHLLNHSAGTFNLIQPDDAGRNIRFCVVSKEQYATLNNKTGMKSMESNGNLYLYEYSNAASWSLPGCVVSSWETDNTLPEFSVKDAVNLVKAVRRGTERERTKNKGVYLTLGPRLSSRPRPSPTMQDKSKLHFSDYHRQEWTSQDGMYLLRSKLCWGSERIRQRSIALDPGYRRLVGHYCCARQLVTSGFCKIGNHGDKPNKKEPEDYTIGYVNSLHRDLCDLIKQELVAKFIGRFIEEINSCKKYNDQTRQRLINKVREINAMVGLGFPTTCGYNIICEPLLDERAFVSSFFIMFDFAMTLSHQRVHNFFAWAFVHCTALPYVLFKDGNVKVCNENIYDKDSVVVFSWGNEGGNPESRLNTKMKNSAENSRDCGERDELCNRIVQRISTMS